MDSAMGGGGVMQAGLAGEEQGGSAQCSGVRVGALAGGGDLQ